MQAVSSIYQELLRNPKHRKECKVEIGDSVFGMDKLITLGTGGSSYRTPSVGNTIARQIDLSLFPEDAAIPRMAEMKVFSRLVYEDTVSEWIQKGVFYIDTRKTDRETGVLTIHGYDAMLKLEQIYIEDGEDLTGWPKTMDVVAADIAALIGVEIDERTVLNAAYTVEAPVGYTMREVMGWIAAAHAGNWTITDAGKLRLITLAGIPAETYYLVDENGDYILLGEDRIVVDSGEEVMREIPEDAAKVWVGNAAMSLETAPAFTPFTGVTVWYDDELAYQSGDDTGRRLELDCPWATQEMADNILASITGYAYQPYTATGALLDPAAELGDGVTVGGLYSVIASIDTVFDAMMSADISAPADEEVDHEYPYESRTNREMKRKVTLGKDYFGAKISKANGLEITQQDTEGNQKSRMILNSDLMAFYNDDGSEALYFDVEAGKFKFAGDVAITGGTMNINDNFIVDEEGNVTLNGNIILSGGAITWGKNNPKTTISYLYSAKEDGSDPHEEMRDTDYYRCDVIDGVQTAWYKFRGEDGSDADVPGYIHRTYMDSTKIMAPTIYGGQFYATGQGAFGEPAYYIYNGCEIDGSSAELGELLGYISYDNNGAGTEEEAEERVFFRTLDEVALKIQSGGNISIESDSGYVYFGSPVRAWNGLNIRGSFGTSLPDVGEKGDLFFLIE